MRYFSISHPECGMSVEWDDRQVRRMIQVVLKQAPYALATATSGILYQAQQELRQELPQHFTVRRPTFLEQSIKVKPMRKDTLVGEIGVPPRPNSGISGALATQELGGTRPNPHGGRVAEPLSGARPTPTAITPPSKWPGKLKRTFVIHTPKGDLLLQRTGSKRGKKRAIIGPVQAGHDPKVKVMYVLTKPPVLKKRWNFVETVLRVYHRDFPARLRLEFAKAIRTARV